MKNSLRFMTLVFVILTVKGRKIYNIDENDLLSDEGFQNQTLGALKKPSKVDDGFMCEAKCMAIVVGCVLATFVLLLLATLFYVVCKHKANRSMATDSIKKITIMDEEARSPAAMGDSTTSFTSYQCDVFFDETLPSNSQGIHQIYPRSATMPSSYYNRERTTSPYCGGNNTTHYFSSSDTTYDIPVDVNTEEGCNRRLGADYKITSPSHYFRDSRVKLEKPDDLLRPVSVPITDTSELSDDDNSITSAEEKIESIKTKVIIQDLKKLDKANDKKPRHLEEGPRNLGNRKFGGSRKLIGSIKAYGDRLVLSRRLFGFSSFKTQKDPENSEEEIKAPKLTDNNDEAPKTTDNNDEAPKTIDNNDAVPPVPITPRTNINQHKMLDISKSYSPMPLQKMLDPTEKLELKNFMPENIILRNYTPSEK